MSDNNQSMLHQLNVLFNVVDDIGEIDPAVGHLFLRSNTIALNTLKAAIENEGKLEKLEIEDQLTLVCDVLRIDLESLIQHVVNKNMLVDTINSKVADEETLDFIKTTTAEEVDDYEKFLEENKVQETIAFLKKEV